MCKTYRNEDVNFRSEMGYTNLVPREWDLGTRLGVYWDGQQIWSERGTLNIFQVNLSAWTTFWKSPLATGNGSLVYCRNTGNQSERACEFLIT